MGISARTLSGKPSKGRDMAYLQPDRTRPAILGLLLWLFTGLAQAASYGVIGDHSCCSFGATDVSPTTRTEYRLRCGKTLCGPQQTGAAYRAAGLGIKTDAVAGSRFLYSAMDGTLSYARASLVAVASRVRLYQVRVEQDRFNPRQWDVSYRDRAIPLPVGLTAAVTVEDRGFGEDTTYVPRIGLGADWQTRSGKMQLDLISGLQSTGEDIRLQLRFATK